MSHATGVEWGVPDIQVPSKISWVSEKTFLEIKSNGGWAQRASSGFKVLALHGADSS